MSLLDPYNGRKHPHYRPAGRGKRRFTSRAVSAIATLVESARLLRDALTRLPTFADAVLGYGVNGELAHVSRLQADEWLCRVRSS